MDRRRGREANNGSYIYTPSKAGPRDESHGYKNRAKTTTWTSLKDSKTDLSDARRSLVGRRIMIDFVRVGSCRLCRPHTDRPTASTPALHEETRGTYGRRLMIGVLVTVTKKGRPKLTESFGGVVAR